MGKNHGGFRLRFSQTNQSNEYSHLSPVHRRMPHLVTASVDRIRLHQGTAIALDQMLRWVERHGGWVSPWMGVTMVRNGTYPLEMEVLYGFTWFYGKIMGIYGVSRPGIYIDSELEAMAQSKFCVLHTQLFEMLDLFLVRFLLMFTRPGKKPAN